MARVITQRQLRNESGQIMRELDAGESFIVTRNGVPVGELVPYGKRKFVHTEELLRAFARSPDIDFRRFREDIDAVLDQEIEPHDR